MEYFIRTLLVVVVLSLQTVKAQNRHELWTKINVTRSFNKHFDGGIDFQYRRQNGFGDSNNFFQFPMTSSIRLWTYFKLRQNWKILFSPIAYFDNEVARAATKDMQPATELRTMIGTSRDVVFSKYTLKNRFLYEVASVKSQGRKSSIRQRYRMQNALVFPLIRICNNIDLSYGITNEVIFKTVSGNTAFDQDRIYNGIQWRVKKSEINIGYQFTFQKEKNTFLNKNQVLFTTNINL